MHVSCESRTLDLLETLTNVWKMRQFLILAIIIQRDNLSFKKIAACPHRSFESNEIKFLRS